jgi:hypothetical protein
MQFEQHQLARLERFRISRWRWTPEIDFFYLGAGCVEVKPVLVRYGYEYSHSWCRTRVYRHQTHFAERSAFCVDRTVAFSMSVPKSVTGELAARFLN